MVIIVLERAPASVRGELGRWLLEPKAGVFVGRLSAEVRDRLWERIIQTLSARADGRSDASAVLVFATDTEQGYAFRTYGDPTREIVDFDGLELVRIRLPERE